MDEGMGKPPSHECSQKMKRLLGVDMFHTESANVINHVAALVRIVVNN